MCLKTCFHQGRSINNKKANNTLISKISPLPKLMSSPSISVIIPTYNRAHCIKDAIESVLNQSFKDFELIVVDDGSTDGTEETIRTYRNCLTLIRQQNSGVSAARNQGIRAARGEWVAFLDSDDLWEPDKLRIQTEEVRKHSQVVAHIVDAGLQKQGDHYVSLFDLRGVSKEYKETPFRERPLLDVLEVNFYTQCCVIKKNAIEAAGFFNPALKVSEDTDLLARVALEGPFFINPYIGTKIRWLPNNIDALTLLYQRDRVKEIRNKADIYANLKNDPRLTAREYKQVCRSLGGLWIEIYVEYRLQKEWGSAMQALRRSVIDDRGLRAYVRAAVNIAGISPFISETIFKTRKKSRFQRSENNRLR